MPLTQCFLCEKKTRNMYKHKLKCKKWVDLSRDVLIHNILPQINYWNKEVEYYKYLIKVITFIKKFGHSSSYYFMDQVNGNNIISVPAHCYSYDIFKTVCYKGRLKSKYGRIIIGKRNQDVILCYTTKGKQGDRLCYYISNQSIEGKFSNSYDYDYKLINILGNYGMSIKTNYYPNKMLNEINKCKLMNKFNSHISNIIRYEQK